MICFGGDDEPGAHLPIGAQCGGELIGKLPADEDQRVDMMSWVVEHLQGHKPAGRIDGVGRAIITTAGDAMGELALAPEPGQHVCDRQRCQLAQIAYAESLQQLDEVVVETCNRRQQVNR